MKDKIRLTFDFDKDNHAQLKMFAAKQGVTIKEFVADAILSKMNLEMSKLDKFQAAKSKVFSERDALFKKLANR